MRHPRFQFRLRTLLIATVLIAIPCGLLARKVEQKRREHHAVERIEDAGGFVVDGQGDLNLGRRSSHLPAWMMNLLGENFFDEVTDISFTPTSDERLAVVESALEDLPDLKHLEICGPRVTDAGLSHLAKLKQLESLDVAGVSEISDVSVAFLKRLSNLRTLTGVGNSFSQPALDELRKALPNCKIY